ncbi:MAG: hypothetical protein JXQ75_10970 [Phycisphaerae bacterium]|nr:hypothetical protein [Phycisphaerae bacterium]
MKPDPERLAHIKHIVGGIEKAYKDYPFPCLCPGCSQPAIMSHSQQKEGQLRAIAKDGRVYALSHNVFHHLKDLGLRDDVLNVQVLGIGEASTFPGFCRQHDRMIFAPIEREELIQDRADQAILFFLKTVAYEHASKREASFFFHEFGKAVGELAPLKWHESYGAWTCGVDLYLLRESPFYINRVFNIVTSRSFYEFSTIWLTVDQVLPVSTCTGFCPWLDEYEAKWTIEKPQPTVSFTVAPTDEMTHIIISWLTEHEEDAAWIRERTRSTEGIEYLVNLCIAESSDCCFSIDLWDGLSNGTRSRVLQNMRHNTFRGPIEKLPRIIKIEQGKWGAEQER